MDEEFEPTCRQCNRPLLSWEEATGFCDICTEQWLKDLSERDGLIPFEDYLDSLSLDEEEL